MKRRLHVACRVLGGLFHDFLGKLHLRCVVLRSQTLLDEAKTLDGAPLVPWHFYSHCPQRNASTWQDLLVFATTLVDFHSDSI